MKTNSKTTKKLSFPLIAASTFAAATLLGVVLMPRILVWRGAQVRSLVSKAGATKSTPKHEEYLRQAMILGWGGVEAPRALSSYYVSIGRYDKAWRVLQNWPLPRNYVQLGDYALRAQEYKQAQRLYAHAVGQKGTARAYTGLAASQFNQWQYKGGCANANKAVKLDLSSTAGQSMAQVCRLLSPKYATVAASGLPTGERAVGVFLIANRIYKQGEARLAPIASTPSDWLMLAELASARGDYKLAAARGEHGIALDRSNPGLNKILSESYQMLGSSKANVYSTRLKLTPLDK